MGIGGLGFGALGVWGLGFGVEGFGFGVWSFGFMVCTTVLMTEIVIESDRTFDSGEDITQRVHIHYLWN